MIQAIEKRKSIRTYQNKPLSSIDQQAVQVVINELQGKPGPFGNPVHLFFYDTPYTKAEQGVQIGTYGYVKNPPAFIAGTVRNSFFGIVDFGYVFEEVILRLTALGLATVWLGGTFNRSIFSDLPKENEVVPAISPVGYPEIKKSLKDRVVRSAIKGDQRQDFNRLFFDRDLKMPLDVDHPMSKYLELVRIGPSASNKQPWRVIAEGSELKFYLKPTVGYGKGIPFDIQALDLGIAICHFEQGLIEDHIAYDMFVNDTISSDDEMTYIISFDIEGMGKRYL